MGKPGLARQDTRRWQKGPHLKYSLELLDAVLDYLESERLSMYRLSSDIALYATHPDLPQFHGMVAESDADLRAFGAKARNIRRSFHPSQYVLVNSPNLESTQAEMLDRMEQDDEVVMITHVGGVYDDHGAGRARLIEGWERCPAHVKAGSCSKMTTSVSRRPMCSGFMNEPACGACSTTSTFSA